MSRMLKQRQIRIHLRLTHEIPLHDLAGRHDPGVPLDRDQCREFQRRGIQADDRAGEQEQQFLQL